jgi:hypothetical protein
MLNFCTKCPGLHTISPDHETVRVARSLQSRGLLVITDCGMATATGHTVLHGVSAMSGEWNTTRERKQSAADARELEREASPP